LLVVISKDVGGVDEHRVRAAIDVLSSEADVQVCNTAMPGELDGALHRRGGRTLVVAGGDRNLHRVVSALHRRNELADTLLAVLPDGSPDDFVAGAGIPSDPLQAARVVLQGVERRFDLIEDCRGSVILNVVRLGRCRTTRAAGWFGNGRGGSLYGYTMAGFGRGDAAPPAAYGSSKPFHVRIEADSTVVADFDRPVTSVALVNAPSRLPSAVGPLAALSFSAFPFATTSPILGRDDSRRRGAAARRAALLAPSADPTDHLIDVVVRFAVSPYRRLLTWLRRTHPIARDDVVTIRARQVKIVGQRFWMTCDGQDAGTEQRCTWTVLPKSLRLIVPRDSHVPDAMTAVSAH